MAAAAMLLAPLGTAHAAPSADAGTPYTLGADGTTAVQYSYKDAIREYAYVAVTDADGKPMDTDHDGRQDRIRVDIIRPSELDAAAKQGDAAARVSAIMDPSPYYDKIQGYGRGPENEYKKYFNPDDPEHSALTQFPQFYDNYFVPRGYAYVLPDSIGTNLSDGCSDGLGPNDANALRSVVDWMNGRGKAYADRTGTQEAQAYWSNGKVGAFGKSYDGGLVETLAGTGVDGLKTIVPIEGMISYYDVQNPNGSAVYDGNDIQIGAGNSWAGMTEADLKDANVPKACLADTAKVQDLTGTQRDYNDWWAYRNNLPGNKPAFKASVFIVHSFDDGNVLAYNLADFWKQAKAKGLLVKMWLSHVNHDDPFDYRRDEWVATIHRWFDYNLYGIDNGIDKDKPVSIADSDVSVGKDGDVAVTWRDYDTFPGDLAKDTTWSFAKGATAGTGTTSQSAPKSDAGTMTIAKAGNFDDTTDGALSQQGADTNLTYVSAPVTQDVHIAGNPVLDATVKGTDGDTNLGYVLVDYGPGTHVFPGEDIALKAKETISCYGLATMDNQWNGQDPPEAGAAGDDGCYVDQTPNTVTGDSFGFARGIASTAHKDSLATFTPAPVGTFYNMKVKANTIDYTLKKGHRLGVILVNNLKHYWVYSDVNPSQFTFDLSKTTLSLPVAPVASAPSTPTVDKTALQQAYDKAKGLGAADYTEESWKAFDTARGVANTVLSKDDATADEVSAALKGLQDAQAALRKHAVRFSDVDDATPHASDIDWLADQGVAKGYAAPDGTVAFGGMRDVTRQDMAAFLYRLAGSPSFDADAALAGRPFTDVTKDTPHVKEILWLASEGVAKGYDNGDGTVSFGGMRTVVRQDMAAFLKRYADWAKAGQPEGAAVSFPDVTDTTPHHEEIAWLARAGVTRGFEDGTFGGMRTVVRQDMAAFLHRMDMYVLSK